VLPDLATLMSYPDQAAPSGDQRYSLGFDKANGIYLPLSFPDGSYAEIDDRLDASGATSYLVATTEVFSDSVNTPPIDPIPGDSLSIKNGPNKGSYLIKAVHKFKYKPEAQKEAYVYFIQIHGTFPVDPLKRVIEFL